MAIEEETPTAPLQDGEAVSELGNSWIQRLRKERDARVQDESLKLGVPTWGPPDHPDLAMEFGVLPRVDIERFQREAVKRARNGAHSGASETDMQFLLAACRAVHFRNPDSGELVKLEDGGRPIRVEKRLAEALGLDPATQGKDSHTLLLYLVADNGVALASMAAKVARWMQNTSAEVEDALLGE